MCNVQKVKEKLPAEVKVQLMAVAAAALEGPSFGSCVIRYWRNLNSSKRLPQSHRILFNVYLLDVVCGLVFIFPAGHRN